MEDKALLKLHTLQRGIHNAICNRMTYPKSIIGLATQRCLTEEEMEKIQELIDESIKVIDAKFSRFFIPDD